MDLAADPYWVMTADVATRASLLSQHAAHLLAVGIPVAMVGIGLAWDWLHKRVRRPEDVLPSSRALLLAAAASVAAAGVHVAVAPEHFRESLLYGAFFVCAAVAQVSGAVVLVVRRSRALTGLVAWANGVIILLWLTTRVVAVPVGPQAGTVESVGALDLTATAAEALVVLCCLIALHRLVPVGRRAPAL